MDIKVGDIVEYNNVHARVMHIEDDYNGVCLAELAAQGCHSYTPIDKLTLIESVQLSEFKHGDLVIVHDIPTHEKENYGCLWAPGMEFALDGQPQKITEVQDDPEEGLIVKIQDYWFSAYHITHEQDYDIV